MSETLSVTQCTVERGLACVFYSLEEVVTFPVFPFFQVLSDCDTTLGITIEMPAIFSRR